MSKLHSCHFLLLKHISPLWLWLGILVKLHCHLAGRQEAGLVIHSCFSLSVTFMLAGRPSGGEVHLLQVLHEEGAFKQIGKMWKCFLLLSAWIKIHQRWFMWVCQRGSLQQHTVSLFRCVLEAHTLLAPSIELHCNINAWSTATRYQLKSAYMSSEQCSLKPYKCFKGNALLCRGLDNLLW